MKIQEISDALASLHHSLVALDAMGLSAAAAYVCQAIDLIKKEQVKERREINLPTFSDQFLFMDAAVDQIFNN